jgi:hypothetical protein
MLFPDKADQIFFFLGGQDFYEIYPVHGPDNGGYRLVKIGKILIIPASGVIHHDGIIRRGRHFLDLAYDGIFAGYMQKNTN